MVMGWQDLKRWLSQLNSNNSQGEFVSYWTLWNAPTKEKVIQASLPTSATEVEGNQQPYAT